MINSLRLWGIGKFLSQEEASPAATNAKETRPKRSRKGIWTGNCHWLRQITYVIYKNLLFQCKIHLKIIENSHTIISNILRKCLVIRGCFYIKTKECPKISPSVDDTTRPAGYKRLWRVSNLNTVDSNKMYPLKSQNDPWAVLPKYVHW